MPQFDLSTAASQIFWLLVIFAALFLVLWRMVLPRIGGVMETRQRRIDEDLARAERLKSEAEAVLAEYEKALAEARARAHKAMQQANERAAAEAARRLADFNAALADKTAAAEQRIGIAEAEARQNLKAIALEAATLATARLGGEAPDAAAAAAAVAKALEARG